MHKTFGLCALSLFAAMAAGRPELNGTWQLENAGPESKFKTETVIIHQGDDSVEITENRVAKNGKELKDGIQCNTLGQECKLKNEQVSAYYNGALLVLIETHNDVVTKTRFSASDDGKKLNMEVTHMSPGNPRTENLTFAKVRE
jgi:hypothetical protein